MAGVARGVDDGDTNEEEAADDGDDAGVCHMDGDYITYCECGGGGADAVYVGAWCQWY